MSLTYFVVIPFRAFIDGQVVYMYFYFANIKLIVVFGGIAQGSKFEDDLLRGSQFKVWAFKVSLYCSIISN